MKYATAVVLILASVCSLAATATEKERKVYVKSLEENMLWRGYTDVKVTISGKDKDTLLVWMATASTTGMQLLERDCIEPNKSQLKAQGFRSVELRNGLIRWAPDWKWIVPLD